MRMFGKSITETGKASHTARGRFFLLFALCLFSSQSCKGTAPYAESAFAPVKPVGFSTVDDECVETRNTFCLSEKVCFYDAERRCSLCICNPEASELGIGPL